ncbi:MAG: methylenetetrahydrofolate--tRNA-(uracil(54)-C(5))-methyltransferase (FADH(2)-oxidizing) TrmFO [Clostridia bacterium]|nr:methylenetetrahydrofolate--tRNA-(uracil(54)-C(5))-methyltransferase (FADH(2)-oxidizing) TrmFO [Clostridia bacterium]
MNRQIDVIGGGLAGCEAALRIASHGIDVRLFEAKPIRSPAHHTNKLAELVCSNSLKSDDPNTASGLLKRELELLDCRLLSIARTCAVPAGNALAVDRTQFAEAVTDAVEADPHVELIRRRVDALDENRMTVLATGPLTMGGVADAIGLLHFYDAAAPIVAADSIDCRYAFSGSRYGKGSDDYINCPMNKEEYYAFVDALTAAEVAPLHDFDRREVFEGCMPIEIMAARGRDTLRFGPLRPVGFTDPATGRRPYAVLQLRKENVAGEMYNLVGFQTNLKFGEQKRVFSMIPALGNCEILRYGVMHRNSFIEAPKTIEESFCLKDKPNVFIGGQLSGVEGYVESIASGLLAAENAVRSMTDRPPVVLPPETILGALTRYLVTPNADFQPMNANFGILPPLENPPRDKQERKAAYAARSVAALKQFKKAVGLN